MLDCEFLNPVNYNGEFPTSTDLWEFSKVSCSSTNETLITSSGSENFIIDNSINYGQILIILFLILAIVFDLTIFIRDFVKNRKLERL